MRGDIYSNFHQKNDAAGAIAIISPLIIGFMPDWAAEALWRVFWQAQTVGGVPMGMFRTMPVVHGIMQKIF